MSAAHEDSRLSRYPKGYMSPSEQLEGKMAEVIQKHRDERLCRDYKYEGPKFIHLGRRERAEYIAISARNCVYGSPTLQYPQRTFMDVAVIFCDAESRLAVGD